MYIITRGGRCFCLFGEKLWQIKKLIWFSLFACSGSADQREQLRLFEDERKKAFMVNAMNIVNNRYGDFTVTFGSLLTWTEKKIIRDLSGLAAGWDQKCAGAVIRI